MSAPFYFGDYDDSQSDSNRNPEYSLIMDFENSRVILQHNRNFALNQYFYFNETQSAVTGTRAYMAANQSIPDSVETKVQIDTISTDDLDEFDVTTYRFTAKNTGYFIAFFNTTFAAGGDGERKGRKIIIKKNGTGNKAVASGITTNDMQDIFLSCSAGFGLSVGDYVEFFVYQNSGGSITLSGGTNNTHIEIGKLV